MELHQFFLYLAIILIASRLFSEIALEGREREIARDLVAELGSRLGFLREQGGDIVARIDQELTETLQEGGLAAKVSGRERSAPVRRKSKPGAPLAPWSTCGPISLRCA